MKAFLNKHHAIAAVSVVLLFIVVLIFGLLFTWSLLDAKQSEVEARRMQLQALQRRAAQPPPAANAQARTIEPFLGDGSFAIAANELRQRVVGLIESADGNLVTIGTDPPVVADDESGRRVVVQAVAELTNDGLQQVLYELESTAPFVFVETLLVNRVAQRGSGEPEEGQSSPRLSVDLRAAGYFRKAAP